MCWKWFKNLFKRSKKPTIPGRKPRRWWEFPYRIYNTSRGGLNMPRYQPCPECRAGAKRQFKTEFGANYLCKCGDSFVVSR